jgi:hypothetical protein
MQCKNIWNREFIDSACTKTFRNSQLKTHRENILFEREKCFLPDAQVILAHRRDCDRIIQGYHERVKALSDEIYQIHMEIEHVRRQKVPTERRKFVRKCPVSECRGFLSSQWKCEVCENKICSDCNEIKDVDEHTCKPENIETMKLLKKDTKPCPNCGTMIFRISGCAQMWCPDCHTAFDWNTLVIEKGVIHNPHFYEFQRLGGTARRNPGDIPCGGMPTVEELYTACNVGYRHRYRSQIPPESKIVFDFCQLVNHIQMVELLQPPVENSLELRIKYLMHELSEDDMKVILQKNEKAREKARDRNNLLRRFCDVTGDLLRQLVLKVMSVPEFLENVARLRDYTRDAFTTIHKRYTCTTDWISDSWDFTRNSYHKQIAAE